MRLQNFVMILCADSKKSCFFTDKLRYRQRMPCKEFLGALKGWEETVKSLQDLQKGLSGAFQGLCTGLPRILQGPFRGLNGLGLWLSNCVVGFVNRMRSAALGLYRFLRGAARNQSATAAFSSSTAFGASRASMMVRKKGKSADPQHAKRHTLQNTHCECPSVIHFLGNAARFNR